MDRLVDYIKLHSSSAALKNHDGSVSDQPSEINGLDFFNTYRRTNTTTYLEDFDDFWSKIDFTGSNYFQFSKLDILSYLNHYDGVPCICGSLMTSLNVTNLGSKDNKSNTVPSPSKAKLVDKFNNASSSLVDEAFAPEDPTEICMPRIHRIRSAEKFSVKSSRSNSDAGNFAEQSQKKQTFVYYVDPRVSVNFISIFNSLKRKLLNKGFQY